MPPRGLEPPRLSTPGSKPGLATNFNTGALSDHSWARTSGLFLMKEVLYQLSYMVNFYFLASHTGARFVPLTRRTDEKYCIKIVSKSAAFISAITPLRGDCG